MEKQTEGKHFACNHCNLSFEITKELDTHMVQQHDGKKTHSCNQCSYSNIKAANLKRHMLVHNVMKPFICKYCDYTCKTAGALKKHKLTHSGEKSFNCKQCNIPV